MKKKEKKSSSVLLHQSAEAVNKEKGRYLRVTMQGYVSVKTENTDKT